MSGLHTLASYAVRGVTPAVCKGPTGAPLPGVECTKIYVASGDNDMWALTNSGANAGSLDGVLGDANSPYVDPAFPGLVITARNPDCLFLAAAGNSPPGPGTSLIDISPAPRNCLNSAESNAAFFPGAYVTQVMAIPGDPVSQRGAGPLYFAAWSPPNSTADIIGTFTVNPVTLPSPPTPPTPIYWAPISLGAERVLVRRIHARPRGADAKHWRTPESCGVGGHDNRPAVQRTGRQRAGSDLANRLRHQKSAWSKAELCRSGRGVLRRSLSSQSRVGCGLVATESSDHENDRWRKYLGSRRYVDEHGNR